MNARNTNRDDGLVNKYVLKQVEDGYAVVFIEGQQKIRHPISSQFQPMYVGREVDFDIDYRTNTVVIDTQTKGALKPLKTSDISEVLDKYRTN